MTKHTLITGTQGYVGNQLSKYLESKSYNVDKLSVRNDAWQSIGFSKYEVIIHLAAIVNNNEPNADMKRYMDINYKITKQLADKAKAEGVKQFIFFSTMAVFGLEGKVGENEVITKETILNPKTEYGISKLKADQYLTSIQDDSFVVSIIRPPMIYGKDAPGNFTKLKKYAEYIPFYLNIKNERSAIYIENLEKCIFDIIVKRMPGIYYPTDKDSFKTNEVIKTIRQINNKRSFGIPVPKSLYPALRKVSLLNKLYGNLTYDKSMQYNDTEQFSDLASSLRKSI
ncbi:NAD-dependent epimerase/dehydratase family protein [Macrococcoides bohemicum]|uniref:NAD-dependent epimerase/dehydratase family protein n=1 Tax=Macrococcoides bohemicum TaxID=1903056 RepID=UPI00165E29BD|nr:NAD-dependent epimerase/dehydratase family protein [Macrococcus bohemicus]MBC9875430.1 NAD-dependent epimerase/dehydratase family protein [Macrococcus bohemicus]